MVSELELENIIRDFFGLERKEEKNESGEFNRAHSTRNRSQVHDRNTDGGCEIPHRCEPSKEER